MDVIPNKWLAEHVTAAPSKYLNYSIAVSGATCVACKAGGGGGSDERAANIDVGIAFISL